MSQRTKISTLIHSVLLFAMFAASPISISAQTTLWSIRAGVTLGPENTLEGMNLAFDIGADGTEIDLWNTAADPVTGVKEIILQHDRDVDRTTNGTGQIQTLSFEYVRSLDAGSKPHEDAIAVPGAQIPTFKEALTLIKQRDKDVLIHIKRDLFDLGGEVPIRDLQPILNEVDFPSEHLFTWTFRKEDAAEFSRQIPGIQIIFQGGQDRNDIDWQELHDLGVSGVQVFTDFQNGGGQFSQEYVDEIHANGFFAFVNFPNFSELDLCLEWGVEYVQHFRVDRYVPIVAEFNNSIVLLGDCNLDGTVNFLDISPFVSLLPSGAYLEQADLDQNGEVNFLDIAPLISALAAN